MHAGFQRTHARRFFDDATRDPRTRQLRPNAFGDLAEYIVLRSLPRALARLRDGNLKSPPEVLDLLLGFLDQCDNTGNPYRCRVWRGEAVLHVVHAVPCPLVFTAAHCTARAELAAATAATAAACSAVHFTAWSRHFKHAALAAVHTTCTSRHMNGEHAALAATCSDAHFTARFIEALGHLRVATPVQLADVLRLLDRHLALEVRDRGRISRNKVVEQARAGTPAGTGRQGKCAVPAEQAPGA